MSQLDICWRLLSPTLSSFGAIAEHRFIFEVRNPEGHLVRLDEVAWNHVLDQHVEMSEYLAWGR